MGGAATALIVIAFIMSLLAGIFASLRICRIKARLALSGPPASSPSTKPCHTRGVATILLTVFAFVLFLAGSIMGWIGVLPVSLLYCVSTSYFTSSCSLATGAGSTLAGVVLATSFLAMVLDASSHCCCKSVKGGPPAGGGGTTIIVTGAHHPPPPAAPAATYWRKSTDGKQEWFVQDGTGQTAWALPVGGVVVG